MATISAPAIPTEAAERQNLRTAWSVLCGLSLTAGAAIVAVVVLMPQATGRSAGDRLALLAVLAGVAGSAVSAVQMTALRMSKAKLDAHALPLVLMRPVMGALMGLLVYAGVVGGFLISTAGGSTESFSPQGLVFLAGLGGLFATTAVERLKIVFKTLLGTPPEEAEKVATPRS
jgi:hypothetical protein